MISVWVILAAVFLACVALFVFTGGMNALITLMGCPEDDPELEAYREAARKYREQNTGGTFERRKTRRT